MKLFLRTYDHSYDKPVAFVTDSTYIDSLSGLDSFVSVVLLDFSDFLYSNYVSTGTEYTAVVSVDDFTSVSDIPDSTAFYNV